MYLLYNPNIALYFTFLEPTLLQFFVFPSVDANQPIIAYS